MTFQSSVIGKLKTLFAKEGGTKVGTFLNGTKLFQILCLKCASVIKASKIFEKSFKSDLLRH